MVSIKMIILQQHPIAYKRVIREIKILKQLTDMASNSHTVKLRETRAVKRDKKDSLLFIVMDFHHRTLNSFMDTPLEPMELKKLTYNLLCSLNFIHESGIMHRDIKPDNILIDENSRIKLCDFGLSRTILTDVT